MKIALDVPEEHSCIGLVRRIGRALLEHNDEETQDIDDLETVIGELCSNATRHACSKSGVFSVTLEHCGDHVVFAVADQGKGFDPQHLPPVGEQRLDADGTLRFGGYGLQLVRTLTDRLDIGPTHPCGTTVRAQKHFNRADRTSKPCG